MAFGLTLAEIRALVRTYIDDRNSERFPVDADLNLLINQAQLNIQDEMDTAGDDFYFTACQDYTIVTSIDTLEFDLPQNCKGAYLAERLVDGSTPIPGEYVDFRQRHTHSKFYRDMWPSNQIAGNETPDFRWSLRANKFQVIGPTTGYEVRLWYNYALADLVNETDYSEIPATFRNLIALNAAALTRGEMEDPRRAPLPETLQAIYDRGIERMRQWVIQRQRQGPIYTHLTEE